MLVVVVVVVVVWYVYSCEYGRVVVRCLGVRGV
jgi:hypothetical protein